MQAPEDFAVRQMTAEGKWKLIVLVSGQADAASWTDEFSRDHPNTVFQYRRATAEDYQEGNALPMPEEVYRMEP